MTTQERDVTIKKWVNRKEIPGAEQKLYKGSQFVLRKLNLLQVDIQKPSTSKVVKWLQGLIL